MSDILDNTNWWFAALGVLILSLGLSFSLNVALTNTYAVDSLEQTYSRNSGIEMPDVLEDDTGFTFVSGKETVPVVGFLAFLLSTTSSFFVAPLFVLSLFVFPFAIVAASLVGRLGNPGVVLQRDYATLSTCGLMGWIAAHIPVLLVAFPMFAARLDGSLFWIPWLLGAGLFGFFLVQALRTVLGLEYVSAIVSVSVGAIGYGIGSWIFQIIGPWIMSPFLLIFAFIFLGGYLRGQISGMGSSMRQRRNFKRHLQSATVNPNDADAHVQLGLIYAQRRQNEKAREHFEKAYAIDDQEIDANYELGRIARREGDLQKAVEYFSTVVEQDDRYSLSEIWREIGATYLEAGQLDVAHEALEKFVTRREYDSEGQYYFGMLWKEKGDEEKARSHFEQAIEAVKTAPYHRKRELSAWARKASKEM